MHTKKIECLGFREGTAREKAQVIWELRQEFKVTLLIDIAGIPLSTYYYHAGQFDKPDKYVEIKTEIHRIYDESRGRYGYRRITAELRNTQDQSQNRARANAPNGIILPCSHEKV